MNIEIALKEVNGREIPAVTSLQVAELKPERGKRPAHFKHPIAEMSVNDIYPTRRKTSPFRGRI